MDKFEKELLEWIDSSELSAEELKTKLEGDLEEQTKTTSLEVKKYEACKLMLDIGESEFKKWYEVSEKQIQLIEKAGLGDAQKFDET